MITRPLSFQTDRNLGVLQITTGDQNSFRYVSVGTAIKQGLVEVKEVNESGSVNTLIVVNTSDEFVFLMDGDILAGAKQNRVVNTSILLAPRSKTCIPVSCVEHGRWQFTSQTFRGTDYTAPSSLRAEKARQVRVSLAGNMGFSANQQRVWERVQSFEEDHGVFSKTSNLSDIYERKARELDHFVNSLSPAQGANGMAVFIGKRLASIDVFNRTDIYTEYFPRILKGAAFEALSGGKGTKPVARPEAEFRAADFLDRLATASGESYPGVGVGTDQRFEVDTMAGLTLRYNDHLIHLTACGTEKRPRVG